MECFNIEKERDGMISRDRRGDRRKEGSRKGIEGRKQKENGRNDKKKTGVRRKKVGMEGMIRRKEETEGRK